MTGAFVISFQFLSEDMVDSIVVLFNKTRGFKIKQPRYIP